MTGSTDVGSDFEDPDPSLVLSRRARPPWEIAGEPVTYVESGRHALRLVARHLKSRGVHRVAVPSHHCESMVAPFTAEGFSVEYVAVGDDLQVAGSAYDLLRAEGLVVLHASYFGARETAGVMESLYRLEKRGAWVVVDETHQVLSPTRHGGRLRIASLRKLLPLSDGGFLAGVDLRGELAPASGAPVIRALGMTLKRAYVAGETSDSSRHRTAFARAEAATQESNTPTAMSRPSQAMIGHLDFEAMASRRRSNAAHLREMLTGVREVVAPSMFCDVPAFLVLRDRDPVALRRLLAVEGVFCPIHWGRPPGDRLAWQDDVISIPVDHRYDGQHMSRLAALLAAAPCPVDAKSDTR